MNQTVEVDKRSLSMVTSTIRSPSSSFHSPIPLCQSESLLIKVSFVAGKATSHAICTLSSTHMIPGGGMNAG